MNKEELQKFADKTDAENKRSFKFEIDDTVSTEFEVEARPREADDIFVAFTLAQQFCVYVQKHNPPSLGAVLLMFRGTKKREGNIVEFLFPDSTKVLMKKDKPDIFIAVVPLTIRVKVGDIQ